MVALWHHPASDLPPGSRLRPDRLMADAVARWRDAGLLTSDHFPACPEPITIGDCAAVHTPEYLEVLAAGRWDDPRLSRLELPAGPGLLRAVLHQAGGTLACVAAAWEEGIGASLGGGFHHAFPDHGEGFCLLNDVALAVERSVAAGVGPVLVLDCDIHQGNGTAAIFRGRRDVCTCSVHSEGLYPIGGPGEVAGDVDVALPRFTADDEYTAALTAVVPGLLADLRPGLVVYLAGSDVHYADQLGDFLLTREGIARRDSLVIKWCAGAGIPLAVLMMAGYPFRAEEQEAIWRATWKTLVTAAAGELP